MSTLTTIVVAIDFSDTSIDALKFACDTASQQHAELHILHIVPDARMEAWALEAPGFDFDQLNEDAVADARRRMSSLPLYDLAPERVTRAHGYGPVRRFLLGSVATSVLHDAPCPVVTVPPRSLRSGRRAAVA